MCLKGVFPGILTKGADIIIVRTNVVTRHLLKNKNLTLIKFKILLLNLYKMINKYA